MTGPQISDRHTRETEIDGLLVFAMKQVTDDRGTVREFFRESAYPELGAWKQINITESHHGAIRGLHGESMTKLVACVSGAAYGAYLDARSDSTTYAKVVTVNLTAGTQVLVPATLEAIEGSLVQMRHRGPDDAGTWFDDDIVIGFRRLSLIDWEHSHQPLPYLNGRYHLIFNGEIYNYLELRAALRDEFGATFSTEGDGEVIVAG